MTERSPSFTGFTALIRQIMDDPFGHYAALADAPPLFWSAQNGAWVVQDGDLARTILCDRRFYALDLAGTVASVGAMTGKPVSALTALFNAFPPTFNPPKHESARRYLRAVLSAKRPEAYAETIETIALGLLPAAEQEIRFDAAKGYADRIPACLMARILGLPDESVVGFTTDLEEFSRLYDRASSPRFYARMEAIVSRIHACFLAEITARRRHPSEDGLTRMIAFSDSGFPLSDSEIAYYAISLLVAGTENTAALIGNAITATLKNGWTEAPPSAGENPFRAAVEKTLHLECPIHQNWRVATCDIAIGNSLIRQGDRVLMLTALASRCPHPHADARAPTRDGRTLAFSHGAHYCLGADLSILEAEIALRVLARRNARLDPAAPVQWYDRQFLRHAQSIPLLLAPERPAE